MKVLVTLSLLQTAGIALLVFAVLSDDVPARRNMADPQVSSTPSPYTDSGSGIDAGQLRRLIREELVRDRELRLETRQTASEAPAAVPLTEEDRYRRDFIEQQIHYYKSVGSISPGQMRDLQREIARLDNAVRTEMLGKLVRAMNAREIEGRL